MDSLLRYLDNAGVDSSSVDDTIADYFIQLVREGGTMEETWSVLEGCYPELEEAPGSKESFPLLLAQLRQPSPAHNGSGNTDEFLAVNGQADPPCTQNDSCGPPARSIGNNISGAQGRASSPRYDGERDATASDEEDVDFLREMMPHVSDRGLRYVLRRIANGSRVTAASYLADRCLGDGSARDLLETEAESLERAELERVRLSEDASRRAVEARRADKEERDSLKGNIIDRYADETEGLVASVSVPTLTEKKKSTRYRDGKVVTTTGAKVIVESLKPEWDGGSRGKVKTKGKRGKGFV